MQTPISAKKFTLNQQGKNAAVDSSLLQIKGISERQNTAKNTNKSPAYQRKDSVKERDDNKKNEATHYKQFLQNEQNLSSKLISSRLDQTKRVNSTLREKPGESSMKQFTLASNNLLADADNSFYASNSVSPNKQPTKTTKMQHGGFKSQKPYQQQYQGQRTHNISPKSRMMPLNSALYKDSFPKNQKQVEND